MSDDNITHDRRECVYAEGEQAFKEGQRRICNPYAASSPTLEQVWCNGWDHGRRINKYKYLTHPDRESVYAEGKRAFEEHKNRGSNPYAVSNLTLTMSWWHGWDTAEEENNVQTGRGAILD